MSQTTIAMLLVATLIEFQAAAEEPSTWRESAKYAGAAVGGVNVGNKPLVTDTVEYSPEARVIHDRKKNLKFPVRLSDGEWRRRLDRDEYRIIREAGTERPFTGELNDNKERGVYYSRATGQPLFHSDDTFESGTGWPSFTKPITPDALVYIMDKTLFMRRIEVVDSLSGAHLGHVFNDGPQPTGQRYCINSASLIFVPENENPPKLLLPK